MVYRCDEMLVSFACNIDSSHIAEMDKRQGEHYSAGHIGNTAHQCCETGNRLPVPYHYRRITQVQEVVAGQQHPVNKIGQVLLTLQQCNNIYPAIAVKNPAGTYCNETGDKEVDDVCQRIHDGGFYHFAFNTTNLVIISVFSNISENIIFRNIKPFVCC